VPFTEPALSATASGGTPYGASHVAGSRPAGSAPALTEHERVIAQALGRRVAQVAQQLKRAS
jgi:NAD(P)H dehydrogenase (quinone)